MRFMLDTDSCIALIKRKPNSILRRLTSLSPGEAGISAISLAELRYGVAKSAQQEKNGLALDEFLLPLEVADFDEPTAESYGMVRAALEKAGTPIGPLDTQIGAHALSLGATLITHNSREFRRIPGLAVEDWLS
ncbi:MAG: type II toxin-antitoxin system VapC family toxin [Candidatus Aminicenantes bacterium]|jgi:tRNA(fMet)-specific endonuclease VapC|nr:type II toxin-antitoxin system VapC family toxin [Candidatus Aminicenantes bacterium]